MSGSITQRQITIAITLGTGTFGKAGGNTVTLSGLRCAVTVERTGLPGFGTATARIYGMQDFLMRQLSSLGVPNYLVRNNTITISAGDAVAGVSAVYKGTITDAWADYSGAPDVAFNVNSFTQYVDRLAPAAPTSVAGSADVAQLMAGFAAQMGYGFENNGVQGIKLFNAYYYGSAYDQAEQVARDAGIGMTTDDTLGSTLCIWLNNSSRRGAIPLISKTTGMVGYPTYSGGIQVSVRCLYNPSIRYFGQVQVQSSVSPQANGVWTVHQLSHDLASLTPDGPWFTDLGLINLAAAEQAGVSVTPNVGLST